MPKIQVMGDQDFTNDPIKSLPYGWDRKQDFQPGGAGIKYLDPPQDDMP